MKKFVSVLLALVFVFSAIPLGGMADYIKGIDWGFLAPKASAAYGGTCGTGVNWSLDTGTGVLTISGSGYMTDYSYSNDSPWSYYRSYIKSVIIKNGVKKIGNYAFYNCRSLTSVTIPDSVTSIGYDAFGCCSNLTSVTIPDSVTNIGDEAFAYCDSLTSVTIPDSVTSIGDGVFQSNDALLSINVSEDNLYYSSKNGVLFNKNKTKLICCPCGKSGAYTIPDGVTSIGDDAFYYCSSLTSVTIPDSVTSIGESAFNFCFRLTSVTIPDSVTSIGDKAFYDCGLTSVTIPDSVISIGDEAFWQCDALASITIGSGVTSIGDEVFDCCRNLTSVNVSEDNINYSSQDGVLYNKNKTELLLFPKKKTGSFDIPDTVKTISAEAFVECYYLTAINVSENNSNYSSYDGALFNKNKTELICCPAGKSGSYTIPNGVTSIGDYAFSACYSLTAVTIPDSVTSIGDYAFAYCDSLTSVTIGNGVTNIDEYVFTNCYKLSTIKFGNQIKTIGCYAFHNCISLTSVTIPDGVTGIGEGAFDYCYNLTSVTIPNSVTSIGDKAFYNCAFTTVKIPASVKRIGYRAFGYSESISGAYIYITYIDDFTIMGAAGSAAQTYANENYFNFVEFSAAPAATKLGKIANTTTGIKISWTAVAGADSYIVYRKADSATSWSKLATVGGDITSYTDSTVKSGTTYTYTVKAQNTSGAGGYNKTGLKTVCLTQPTVKVANKNGYVNVSWGKITGAKGYYVYRKAGSATSWTKIATVKDGATVSYSDKNVKSGTNYKYTVKAYNGSYASSYCSGISIKHLAQPKVTVANGNAKVTVKWGKISGAKGYYVYRKAGSATSWTKIATIKDGATVSYNDKNVKNGTTYKYTVKAYNGSYASSYCSGIATKYLTAGKVTSATSAKAGITVKWSKNASASGYYVYRKTGSGSFAKIATVKKNSTVSYVDKSAKKGITYTYYIRPYSGNYSGTYANTINCKDKY